MCNGVAEEKPETLQVVDRGRGTSDDVLLDCHCVELVMRKYGTIRYSKSRRVQ